MGPNVAPITSHEIRRHLVIEDSKYATNLAYLPGGQLLVASYYSGAIEVYDVENGKQVGTSMWNNSPIISGGLAVTHDGTKIVCGDAMGRIRVWNIDSHALIEEWTRCHGGHPVVAISPDDKFVAIGDGKLTLRQLNGGPELQYPIENVVSMSFSPGGHNLKLACTCSISGPSLYVFDIEKGKLILGPLCPQVNKSPPFARLLWSHDSKTLFFATKAIYRLDPDTGERIGQAWEGHSENVFSLSLSQDGSKLASASWNHTVCLWDTTSGNVIGTYPNTGSIICFSLSGGWVTSAGFDNQICLWRAPWSDLAKSQHYAPPLLVESESLQTLGGNLHSARKVLRRTESADSLSYPSPEFDRALVLPAQCPTSRISVECPPPLNLTPYIVKISDRYTAGGGFGDVYRGLYYGYGGLVPTKVVQVAVKAFRFKFTLTENAEKNSLKMLRRELGIWRRLNHMNIVPFLGIAYGFGMHDAMSLVSLWMPNDTLQNFLEKHDDDLGVAHRLRLLLDVASGLQYLHSFPIVHGDLNCNNVLLDADHAARLADFGYASLIGNIPEALTYLRRSTTRPGALRWIAPEQITLEDTYSRTVKSDIYSFGCVGLQESVATRREHSLILIFMQVLSGRQPWSEIREDAAVVLQLVKGCKPGRPASRRVNDLHWSLIERCWLPTQERPAAEAIIASIQQFLSCCPPFRPLHEVMTAPSDSLLREEASGLERDHEIQDYRVASESLLNLLPNSSIRLRQSDSSETNFRLTTAEPCAENPSKRRRL